MSQQRPVKSLGQQLQQLKKNKWNEWVWDPIFFCIRNAESHGSGFRKIMLKSIQEKFKGVLFGILHDYLYQPAIVDAFKNRPICFRTYLRMYLEIMGIIMLKICQQLVVENSKLEWFNYIFHRKQRLVQRQIRLPSTSKQKHSNQKIQQMKHTDPTIRKIQKQRQQQSGFFNQNLFHHVLGSASVAITFADEDNEIATKMVMPDTLIRLNREQDTIQSRLSQIRRPIQNKIQVFVASKERELDMRQEYKTLQIAYSQFIQNPLFSIPVPLRFWDDCNAFSMRCCPGETAKRILDDSIGVLTKNLAGDVVAITGEAVAAAGRVISAGENAPEEPIIGEKSTIYTVSKLRTIFDKLIKVIEFMGNPTQRNTRWVVHTDPSLGNIMFDCEAGDNLGEINVDTYLIDFGDACVMDCRNTTDKKLLDIFKKYIPGMLSVRPGWEDIKDDFDQAIDCVEGDDLETLIKKQQLKEAMNKYKVTLDEFAKKLYPTMRQVNDLILSKQDPNFFEKVNKNHKEGDCYGYMRMTLDLDHSMSKLNQLLTPWPLQQSP